MPPKTTECVKVMVRTRPMNKKEFDRGMILTLNFQSVIMHYRLYKNSPG